MRPWASAIAARIVLLAALVPACIGARAPERLEAPAPMAVAVWLEAPSGEASSAPAGFLERVREVLAARGLVAEVVPVGDVLATTTAERLAAVRQRVTTPQGEPAPREVAFGVAAFLQYEHERAPEALAFATRQVLDELETLVDRYVRSLR
jgi:hypothetical protein